jgi:glycine betaine/proline transport system substrate-binding protein
LKKILLGLAVATAGFVGASSANACEKVVIADMNWNSASLIANIDAIILEKGFGCEVELIPGATTTTFASMDAKGEPDLAPEFWSNAVAEPLSKAVAEGRLHIGNKQPITGAGEGWWVPPQTAEKHPELKTVLDIIEHPELFPHPEDSSKGAFYGCPSGWGCQLVNANLFRAFDMEKKGWMLVDPGSAAGLDGSMTKAVDRGENWFGYYWAPTALITKHKMVKVPFGVDFIGKEHWDTCIVKPEQECAEPKKSAWTVSVIESVVTDNFKKQGADVADYVAKRTIPGEIMGGMLGFMADEQAQGSDAAHEFLTKHEEIWSKWVSEDVAKKIKAAL